MTQVPPTVIDPDQILDQDTISSLVQQATTYGFNNGLLMVDSNNTPYLAPITLFPRQTPTSVYDRIWSIHPILQELYARVANDHEFLLSALKPMASADPFLQMLVETLEQNKGRVSDPICLVSRSDYMIHENDYNPTSPQILLNKIVSQPAEIRLPDNIGYTPLQVEFNTISTAFSSMSHRVAGMHRYLMQSHPISPPNPAQTPPPTRTFPQHSGPDGAAKTFSEATRIMAERYPQYGQQSSWAVIMVVQGGETNTSDQRLIEYALLETYNIRLIRATLVEIEQWVKFESGQPPMFTSSSPNSAPIPISLFYYRSCYTPRDFKIGDDHKEPLSDESKRLINIYRTIESSPAIKCPNIGLHLSGTKKIQQLLTNKDLLMKFLPHDEGQCDALLATFTAIYSLQAQDYSNNSSIINDAIQNPHGYVLKPMREGGGNNYYDEELRDFLKDRPVEEINAMILMKRISPNTSVKSIMIRKGSVNVVESVSEYGIFGGFVGFVEQDDGELIIRHNEQFGSLVRIKAAGVNEGGVAAGFSCVGSAVLE